MAQPYVGEIRMFAGNFQPAGWMFCEGRLLAISEYETLFNLIGTTYGGDGQTTFATPNLSGRAIIGASAAAPLGTPVGQDSVTISWGNLPSSMGGSQAPIDNREPSLALNYI